MWIATVAFFTDSEWSQLDHDECIVEQIAISKCGVPVRYFFGVAISYFVLFPAINCLDHSDKTLFYFETVASRTLPSVAE